MKSKEIVARVGDLARPLCAEAGLMLWDVTFEKEGANYVLSVLIDRPEGVFIEDCETVSRALDPLLDRPEFDEMPSYMLSVSSPGLERKLTRPEHRDWALGKPVDLKLYAPVEGVSAFTGTLVRHDGESVELETEAGRRTFSLSDAASLRLHFEF